MTGKSLTGYDYQNEWPGLAGRVLGNALEPTFKGDNTYLGTFPKSAGYSYTKMQEGLKEAVWNEQTAKQNTNDAKGLKKAQNGSYSTLEKWHE